MWKPWGAKAAPVKELMGYNTRLVIGGISSLMYNLMTWND
jgi:hypothetical protein